MRAIVLLLLLAPGTAAAALVLSGTVSDAERGTPVADAVVLAHALGRGVATDPQGRFTLPDVAEDDVVTVWREGFLPVNVLARYLAVTATVELPPDGPTRLEEIPVRGTVPMEVREFGVGTPVVAGPLAIPVTLGPARAASLTLSWEQQDPETSLEARVVHLATGSRVAAVGEPPLRVDLPGSFLRQHPGEYEVQVRVHMGRSDGTVDVEGSLVLEHGPWLSKRVEGRPPQVQDDSDDLLGTSTHPGMDILAVQWTEETSDGFVIEMMLDHLADLAPKEPYTMAGWTVQWRSNTSRPMVMLQTAAGQALPWFRAGTCEDGGPLCIIDESIFGEVVPGSPGRIRFHVSKAAVGSPPEGESLEYLEGLNFQTVQGQFLSKELMLRGQVDRALGAATYRVGMQEFALTPAHLAAARAAPPGLTPAWVLVALPLVLGVATAAWLRRPREARVVVRPLGSGSHGQVLLVRDRASRQLLAVKRFHPVDAAAARHLLREARLASSVRHPNVVRVLAVEEGSRGPEIVMEYLAQGSLEQRLAEGPLPLDQACAVWRDLLAGLGAVHAAGIIHRDVKPSNVFLTEEGRAKIGDFGVARSAAEETLGGTGPVGTLPYLAPEILQGHDHTVQSDLYGATAVAYRMLTGRHPVHAEGTDAWSVLLDRRGRAAALPVAGLPRWLNALLAHGLAEDPGRRPRDAAELLGRLEPHLRGRSASATPPLPPP